MADIIDSAYQNLDSSNLLPSFFQWLFQGALNLENGSIFGIGLILVVAMVSFLTFKGFATHKAMIVSSMITWLVALLSLKAGWISNFIFTLTCIYVVYSVYKLFEKSSDETP